MSISSQINKSVLWNEEVRPESYGESKQYYDHILEQYKMYVATAESVSSRRGISNTYFLTLHTLIVTAAGILFENNFQFQSKWIVVIPLIGLLTLCWTWWRLNLSYKQINNAKFRVIDEFEKHLPAKPFVSAEWQILGGGKNPKLYRSLSDVENWVPTIFAGLYLLGAILILVS